MKRILIIDNSTDNLQFMENILNDRYKLVLEKSGEEALSFLEKNKVDLILLETMMSEMDGFEIFERVKQISVNADTPVVFLTTDAENEIKGLNAGAMDIIRKPIIAEVMINRINNVLQLTKLLNQSEQKNCNGTARSEQICEQPDFENDDKNSDRYDFLTGLLNKKSGEPEIANEIARCNGCLV